MNLKPALMINLFSVIFSLIMALYNYYNTSTSIRSYLVFVNITVALMGMYVICILLYDFNKLKKNKECE